MAKEAAAGCVQFFDTKHAHTLFVASLFACCLPSSSSTSTSKSSAFLHSIYEPKLHNRNSQTIQRYSRTAQNQEKDTEEAKVHCFARAGLEKSLSKDEANLEGSTPLAMSQLQSTVEMSRPHKHAYTIRQEGRRTTVDTAAVVATQTTPIHPHTDGRFRLCSGSSRDQLTFSDSFCSFDEGVCCLVVPSPSKWPLSTTSTGREHFATERGFSQNINT